MTDVEQGAWSRVRGEVSSTYRRQEAVVNRKLDKPVDREQEAVGFTLFLFLRCIPPASKDLLSLSPV